MSQRLTNLIPYSVLPSVLAAFVFAATSCSTDRTSAQEASDEIVQLVLTLLADADKDIRALGLEQVRQEAKGEKATRQFAELLPKLSADAKVGLLRALADRNDVAARPAVLKLLKESDQSAVRAAAVAAVGSLGEPTDATLLINSLSAASKDEIAEARKSLVKLRGEEVTNVILTQMDDAPVSLQVALIEVLTERRAENAVDVLLAAAGGDEPKLRIAAMKALSSLARPKHVLRMVAGVLKASEGSERKAAEKAVMLVCQQIKEPQKQADPLLAAMEQLDSAVGLALLPTLGRVGGIRVLPLVEAAIADPDEKVHNLGVEALCNWPDASVAGRLVTMATSGDHPKHRKQALKALIRVAPLPDGRPDEKRLRLVEHVMGMLQNDKERNQLIGRINAIRTIESMRFLVPYLDQPKLAQEACLSIVNLAHHRGLRDAHKQEFQQALNRAIEISTDPIVVARAKQYQQGKTWTGPKSSK